MIIRIRFILLCLELLQLPQWRTISAQHLLLGPQLRYVHGQTNPHVRQAQTDSEGVFSLSPCSMSGNRLGRARRLPAVSPSHGAHWLSGSPPVMGHTWLSGQQKERRILFCLDVLFHPHLLKVIISKSS